MNSDVDNSPPSGPSTSDVTPGMFGDGLSAGSRLESSDVLASLLAAATMALDTDRRVTRRCVMRAAELLGADRIPTAERAAKHFYLQGGLASWQAKRLNSYIEDKLGSTIRAADLAKVVRMSTSHFFRAFRKTFGESPVAHVMKRRMLRAQELMSTSSAPLSQVALECGMCDQAHFSRTFRQIVGTNPTVWRRQFAVSHSVPVTDRPSRG
jgi:AraC family transcriptional regulator